jgi:hypothetical protein
MKEGTDYYINEKGLYVFTESYLKRRGYCCKTGCLHCPFGFKKITQINKLSKPNEEITNQTSKDNLNENKV